MRLRQIDSVEVVKARVIKRAAKLIYQARKDRAEHPEGTFDKAGRWYPSDREDADGFTLGIRSPTRHYPYSYMKAARTTKHLFALGYFDFEYFKELALKQDETLAITFEEIRAREEVARAYEERKRDRVETEIAAMFA